MFFRCNKEMVVVLSVGNGCACSGCKRERALVVMGDYGDGGNWMDL